MDSKHSSSSSTLSGSMSWSCPPSSACLDGAIAANESARLQCDRKPWERLGARAASSTHTSGSEKGESGGAYLRQEVFGGRQVRWNLGEEEAERLGERSGCLVSSASCRCVGVLEGVALERVGLIFSLGWAEGVR